MRMRLIIRMIAFTGTAVAAALFGLVLYAQRAVDQVFEIALPPLRADRTPSGVARGAAIFHATCEACHRAPDSNRASGAPIPDAPDWLGRFHSGNITSDEHAGIGRLSDGHVARMIRYGINRSGRWAPMPHYGMSDADLSAVMGFLRSDHQLFQPDPRRAPRTTLTLTGKVVLALTGALSPPRRPAIGIVAPPRAPTVAYGRYLAEGVYQCGDCHTPGFDPDKIHGPLAYAGGTEMKDAAGHVIYSPNLTRDNQAGIGLWSRDQFARAIRDGIRPDGAVLTYPMLRFRGADDVEVDALFAFLRSLPSQPAAVPGRVPAVTDTARPSGAAREASSQSQREASPAGTRSSTPEHLFERLGCVGCHGPGAVYERRLDAVRAKSTSELARFIRNPEVSFPGTVMPTFAPVLDEAGALTLATWLQRRQARAEPARAEPARAELR